MAFMTVTDLKYWTSLRAHGATYYHTKSSIDKHFLFLSHSHEDRNLIEKFVVLLGEQAGGIYIDWADKTMPEECSPVTAARIKAKINECHKLALLATDNACKSKWCPWELGIADEAHGMDHVVIFPIEDPPHPWKGNEYIGIYDYVEKDALNNLYVSSPTGKRMYMKLADWLTK